MGEIMQSMSVGNVQSHRGFWDVTKSLDSSQLYVNKILLCLVLFVML